MNENNFKEEIGNKYDEFLINARQQKCMVQVKKCDKIQSNTESSNNSLQSTGE